ncbi:MAG: phenylalanine--tRNA ligase subunit beta, partial [Promethearchaeota archaeon]
NVNPEVNKVRPYIVCGVIRNVHLDDAQVATLMNIQEQLHWAVGRDRKKVAIGVHDIDQITPPFRYTAVKPESVSFIPLHGDGDPMDLNEILMYHEKGIDYAHILEGKEVYPIIFDKDDQVLSFPPVINGVITTVTDKTENLFLDITGTDFEAVNLTLSILSTTLADMGAKIENVQVNYEDRDDIVTPDLTPREWKVSIEYINDYIGLALSAEEMIKCFEKVRLNAKENNDSESLIIEVPPFRGDIMHPVDFSEECAIGYGYNKLEKTIRGGGIGKFHPVQELANKVRKIMIGAGYLEVLNFILTNKARHYEYMREECSDSEMVQIKNPVSKLYNTTRTTLLHKLMETIQFNRSEEKPIRIFEVGDVILLDPGEETGARRDIHLAAASYHEDADFTEIRSTLDFIMTSLGYSNNYKINPKKNPKFITGRNGDIIYNGTKIGEIGEVYPEILTNFKLEFPVAALEINLQHCL